MSGREDDENNFNGLQLRSLYPHQDPKNFNIQNMIEFLCSKEVILKLPLSDRSCHNSIKEPRKLERATSENNSFRVRRQTPEDAIDSKVIKTCRPPKVTGKSWIIVDGETGEMIGGKCERLNRGIASLTKIMTCYMVIKFAEIEPEILEEYLSVSEKAEKIIGTSAKLRAGDRIQVKDALYGLMLPSGNDAAVAIAQHFAARLHARRILYRKSLRDRGIQVGGNMRYEFAVNLLNLPLSSESRLEGLGLAYMSNDPSLLPWITEMNTMAYVLGMSATNFENPHGLSSKLHKSTASDVARLSVEALKSQLFRKIVNTESYAVNIVNSRDSSSRRIIWKNTNELLQEGYSGIKTGTTPTTGFFCHAWSASISSSCHGRIFTGF